MAEVKHGTRMTEPPGRIVVWGPDWIEVDDETNRRWLRQEVESAMRVEREAEAEFEQAREGLKEARETRERFEAEYRAALEGDTP